MNKSEGIKLIKNRIPSRHRRNMYVAPTIWLFLQLAMKLLKIDKLSTVQRDSKYRCYWQKINRKIIL